MAKRPAPFTVSLTDDEREKLETHRAALGVRSLAHVVRYWISKPVVGRKVYEDIVDALAAGPYGIFTPKQAAEIQQDFENEVVSRYVRPPRTIGHPKPGKR